MDLRSLALFRIAVGLVLLTDLLLRLPQLTVFYTDRGVLPREAVLQFANLRWIFSIHYASGGWLYQFSLCLVAIVAAIGLILGYRTRLCAVLSWLLLLSLHARNIQVLHGGDAVLRLLLFWGMFAPLNARWSLDQRLNPQAPLLPVADLSPASLALVFQVCGIYWFAAAEKMHPVWLGEQSAVYYALSLDLFATSVGRALLQYPDLLRLMTTATILLEMFGPLLAILPFGSTALRIFMPASFIGFHLGLALTMRLDLFPWVCMAAWLAFLPSVVWDRWEPRSIRLPSWVQRLRAPVPRPIGIAGTVVVFAFLLVSTASFVGALPDRRSAVGALTYPIVRLTMIDQSWRMFAPFPSPVDGWYVIDGVTADGRLLDVWRSGGAPTDAKPEDFRSVYPNTQWLAYLGGIRWESRREYRPYLGRYLCREWNDRHGRADWLRLVTMTYMIEITPPPGEPATPAYPEVVWLQPCVLPPGGEP